MSITVNLLRNATLGQVANAHLAGLRRGMGVAGQRLVAKCKRNMEEMHRNATVSTSKSIEHVVEDNGNAIELTVGGNDNLFRVMTGIPPADQGGVFPFKDILHWVEIKGFAVLKAVVEKENGDFEFAHVFITGRSTSASDKKPTKRKRKPSFHIGFRALRTDIITDVDRAAYRGSRSWRFNPYLAPEVPGGNGRRGSDKWGRYDWYATGDRIKKGKAPNGMKQLYVDALLKEESDIAWAVKTALDMYGTRRWRGMEKDPIGEAIREMYPRMLDDILKGLREAQP